MGEEQERQSLFFHESNQDQYNRKVEAMKKQQIHKFVASLIRFLQLSGGRQKICRLVQYFCVFLATKYQQQYHLIVSQRNAITTKKQKAQSLMGATGVARKILRFGPSINTLLILINNLKKLASGQTEEPLHILILKTLSSFFIGLFFICDHYSWLFKMGYSTNKNLQAYAQYWSTMAWFIDCIINIVKNCCLLMTESQSKPFMVDLMRVVCDFVIAWSFVKKGSINGKYVGLLGSFTSLISIYQMWK